MTKYINYSIINIERVMRVRLKCCYDDVYFEWEQAGILWTIQDDELAEAYTRNIRNGKFPIY